MQPKSVTEAVVMYLAENEGNWIPVYELVKREIHGKWTGTQGDRRARELFNPEETKAEYVLNGRTYQLERQKVGKYAEYRVVGKTKKIVGYEDIGNNTRRPIYA